MAAEAEPTNAFETWRRCDCTKTVSLYLSCGHSVSSIITTGYCNEWDCDPPVCREKFDGVCEQCEDQVATNNGLRQDVETGIKDEEVEVKEDETIYLQEAKNEATDTDEEKKLKKLQKALVTLAVTNGMEKVLADIGEAQRSEVIKWFRTQGTDFYQHVLDFHYDWTPTQLKKSCDACGEGLGDEVAKLLETRKEEIFKKCEEGVEKLLDTLL
jgi:hypothetical protein